MKRAEKALKLTKAPLVQVLAQVKFSPVLQMADYVPEIQEKLRYRYPRFKETETQEIQLGATPKVVRNSLWAFLDKEGYKCVTLSKDFVALSTSDYITFKAFVKDLVDVLGDVNAIVKAQVVERIGLRYVDLIRLAGDEDFEQYFDKQILGLPAENVGAHESINRFEFVGRTEMGRIVIRCSESCDGSYLPADLAQSQLNYDIDLPSDEKVRLLDIDHFAKEQPDFDIGDIEDAYWNLHENCDMAFRSSVTPYAMKQWQ